MLGDRLKELREDRNMKQSELASILDINRATISSYETNVIIPSLEILISIADIFDVSLDYLACRTKEKHNLYLYDSKDKELISDLLYVVKKYNKK